MLRRATFGVLAALAGGIIFALIGQSAGFVFALAGWHIAPGNIPVIWAIPFIGLCVGVVLGLVWSWRTASGSVGQPPSSMGTLVTDGAIALALAYIGGLLTAALIFGVLWLLSPALSREPLVYFVVAPFGALLFAVMGWRAAPAMRRWACSLVKRDRSGA